MRTALAILMMLAIAAALALFAGNDPGTVTLFWPPYRVDLSLNLFLLALVAIFGLVHFALRGLAALLAIPNQARKWRTLQRERSMFTALFEALSHLTAGRYIRARKSAELALTHETLMHHADEESQHGGRLRALAHLLAAESAHALQDRESRMVHLNQAVEHSGGQDAQEEREGVHLRAARWALDDRSPMETLRWLAEMPHGASRRTVALRLRLKAARQTGQIEVALETARLLDKHRAFVGGTGIAIIQSMTLELLLATRDASQLELVWNKLEERDRQMSVLAIAAANHLLDVGGSVALSRQWLLPVWERLAADGAAKSGRGEPLTTEQKVAFVLAIQKGFDKSDGMPESAWLTRIETAQLSRPGDHYLQYLAGITCWHLKLWGKSLQLLRQCASRLKGTALEREAWLAIARLEEQRKDLAAASNAYRLAAGSVALTT